MTSLATTPPSCRERFVLNLARAVLDAEITTDTAVDYLARAELTAAPATFEQAVDALDRLMSLDAGVLDPRTYAETGPEVHDAWRYPDVWAWTLRARFEAELSDACLVLAQPWDVKGVAA